MALDLPLLRSKLDATTAEIAATQVCFIAVAQDTLAL
jgi:hypothetical protein